MKKFRRLEIKEVILLLVILCQSVFVILKYLGIVAWSWLIVALPIIITVAVIFVFFIWGCLMLGSIADGEC